MIYLIGSLRNPKIAEIGRAMRKHEIDVFDSWFAAGPIADDSWRDYERSKGISYWDAIQGIAAQHVFNFDKKWLDKCDAAVLVYPAGKSAHMELGYIIGQGKPGYILMEEDQERWDVMLGFATDIFMSVDEMVHTFKYKWGDHV